MGMWLLPLLVTITIICVIAFVSTMRIAKMTTERDSEEDTPISEKIEENKTVLNPIFWAYALFFAFTGIMIFYYWSQTAY